MKEEWRDIKDFEGYYQVSNTGKVRSLSRVITYRDGRVCRFKEKILKICVDKKGYCVVYLSMQSKKFTRKVHRLVASSFLVNNESKPQINHIDCDKENNCADNLEWCNNSENQKHAFKNGLNIAKKGSQKPNASIDETMAKKIKAELIMRRGIKMTAEKFGVSKHVVSDISRGKTWRHV